MKVYKINDPIYKAQLTLIIGDYDKTVKYLKKCDVDLSEFGDETRGKFYYDKGISKIYLERLDLFTLIHELYHFVIFALSSRHIPINEDNDEVCAYYMEFMFKQIAKKLKIDNLIK